MSGLTSGIAGPAAVGIPVTDRRASPDWAGLTDCIACEGLKRPALRVIGEGAAHAALDAVQQDLRRTA